MMSFVRWIVVASIIAIVLASEGQQYTLGEQVVVWADRVGPFENPQETYSYFSLPFCSPPDSPRKKFTGIGESLAGFQLVETRHVLVFGSNKERTNLCEVPLGEQDAKKLQQAIDTKTWYTLFIDDLPAWGLVGEVTPTGDSTPPRRTVFTHLIFDIAYNGPNIIEVNLTAGSPVEVKSGINLNYHYSVNWIQTEKTPEERFERYLDPEFFEHQIHWFSLFNSFMLVVFLVGLVALILLKTLRRDLGKFEEIEEETSEDNAWKQLRGEVFRSPSNLTAFSSLLGVGFQLVVTAAITLVLSFLGDYFESRGSTITAAVVGYLIASPVAGYFSGSHYLTYGGKNWIRTMLITLSIFPSLVGIIAFGCNFFATASGAIPFVSFGTFTVLLVLFVVVAFPLIVFGTVVGRHWGAQTEFPCRINPVPAAIPLKPWYYQSWVNILAGGFLPFACVFVELYFVFSALWHYKFYYVYGFLVYVNAMLVLVSLCTAIITTYFLLNSEDYRWQWTSFLSTASMGLYIFGYSVYYFINKTQMTGIVQTSFYFGYSLLICTSLGLLCGSIGYSGAVFFVRRIYSGGKLE